MIDDHDSQSELTPNDRRLLDALIEAEFDLESMEFISEAERERLQTLSNLFGLLNDYPVEEADDTLLHATLASIDRHDRERAEALKLDPILENSENRGRGFRIPLPELFAMAAVILIMVGVGWPIMGKLRANSVDRTCANNMRVMAQAFGTYATDYQNVLPTATAGVGPASWDQVRNIVNLRPLVEYGYCDHDHLNCPGHHDPYGSSYSYQWKPPSSLLQWGNGPDRVILGDRNPLIDATISGHSVPANTMSNNHGGRGQNVILSDGSILWLTQPKVGRDNIWLPEGATFLQTGQQHADANDAFLVH
jgi:hypothetical protein